jgi:hypothetical protein
MFVYIGHSKRLKREEDGEKRGEERGTYVT